MSAATQSEDKRTGFLRLPGHGAAVLAIVETTPLHDTFEKPIYYSGEMHK